MLSNIGNTLLFLNVLLGISIIYFLFQNLKKNNDLISKNIYHICLFQNTFIIISFFTLIFAFIISDFSIVTVYQNSHSCLSSLLFTFLLRILSNLSPLIFQLLQQVLGEQFHLFRKDYPILFLIYISDIGEGLTAQTLVYVDDTKVKQKVNTEEDVENLQRELEKLDKWANDNNMNFNGKKFQVVRYGPNEELKNNTEYFSGVYDDHLRPSNSENDNETIKNRGDYVETTIKGPDYLTSRIYRQRFTISAEQKKEEK